MVSNESTNKEISVRYNLSDYTYVFTMECKYCSNIVKKTVHEIESTPQMINQINSGSILGIVNDECDNCQINPFVQELK